MFGLAEGPVQGIGEVFSGQSVTPFPTNFLSASSPATRRSSPGGRRWRATRPPRCPTTAPPTSPLALLRSGLQRHDLLDRLRGRRAARRVPLGRLGQDADPAALISDFLTNAQYGVGLPASALSGAALFGASGDASYQTYCAALGPRAEPGAHRRRDRQRDPGAVAEADQQRGSVVGRTAQDRPLRRPGRDRGDAAPAPASPTCPTSRRSTTSPTTTFWPPRATIRCESRAAIPTACPTSSASSAPIGATATPRQRSRRATRARSSATA